MSEIDLSQTVLFQHTEMLLNQRINEILKRKVEELNQQLYAILPDVENITELVDSCWRPISINLCVHPVRKGRVKREVDETDRCMARIGLGSQCTRSRVPDSEYCKSHNICLPYGCVDGPLEGKAIKLGKRRGRKIQSDKEFSLEDLDLSKYVQATITCIDGIVLMQDEFGLLYRHDTTNQIIGRATDDGIEWY